MAGRDFELDKGTGIRCDTEFVASSLGFETIGIIAEKGELVFKLSESSCEKHRQQAHGRQGIFNTSGEYVQHFSNVVDIGAEPVLRRENDTTFFTTAGIQRIESILNSSNAIDKFSYIVAQPVVRSQYMDGACNGTSSTFINLTVVDTRSTPLDFINRCNELIQLACRHGIDPSVLTFNIGTGDVAWGERQFHNLSFTIYYNGIELGECVNIYDFPVSPTETISMVDLGFGVERFRWGVWPERHYYPEFEYLYEQNPTVDSNEISAFIDSIRGMVLIAGEGVAPANKNQGYRFRQLSKRFTLKRKGLVFDQTQLIETAYYSWVDNGYVPPIDLEKIQKAIEAENDRNFNAEILARIPIQGKRRPTININQSSQAFLKQVQFSAPKEAIQLILAEIS